MRPTESLVVSIAAGALQGVLVLWCAWTGSGWAVAGALTVPSVLLLVAHLRGW